MTIELFFHFFEIRKKWIDFCYKNCFWNGSRA